MRTPVIFGPAGIGFGTVKKLLRNGLCYSKYFEVRFERFLRRIGTSSESATYERMIALALKLLRNGGETLL